MAVSDTSILDLKDIVLSAPVSFLPATDFALFTVYFLLLSFIVFLLFRYMQYRSRWYRRLGVSGLSSLKSEVLAGGDFGYGAGELSRLLKRVALVGYGRERVASLYGGEWLSFLAGSCPDSRQEAARLSTSAREFLSGGYLPHSNSDNLSADFIQAIAFSKHWISGHRQDFNMQTSIVLDQKKRKG